jgi:hypothetical protein
VRHWHESKVSRRRLASEMNIELRFGSHSERNKSSIMYTYLVALNSGSKQVQAKLCYSTIASYLTLFH